MDYASQMKRKIWHLNGEAIVFDSQGKLLDGQHRLWACVESETEFETIVVSGVDPDTFSTIDTGSKRSAADVLHISGITKNINTVAACATVCLEYKRGTLRSNRGTLKGSTVTRQDVLMFVEKNPQIQVWVEKARATNTWVTSYASQIAAVMLLGSAKYREKAEEFIHGWITGENLGSKSPILALRNRLATEKRLRKATRVALVIYAWNSFVDNKQLVILKTPKGDQLIIRGTEK
jgi:hypothetical protein